MVVVPRLDVDFQEPSKSLELIISHEPGGIASHEPGGITAHNQGGITAHDQGGITEHGQGASQGTSRECDELGRCQKFMSAAVL